MQDGFGLVLKLTAFSLRKKQICGRNNNTEKHRVKIVKKGLNERKLHQKSIITWSRINIFFSLTCCYFISFYSFKPTQKRKLQQHLNFQGNCFISSGQLFKSSNPLILFVEQMKRLFTNKVNLNRHLFLFSLKFNLKIQIQSVAEKHRLYDHLNILCMYMEHPRIYFKHQWVSPAVLFTKSFFFIVKYHYY